MKDIEAPTPFIIPYKLASKDSFANFRRTPMHRFGLVVQQSALPELGFGEKTVRRVTLKRINPLACVDKSRGFHNLNCKK